MASRLQRNRPTTFLCTAVWQTLIIVFLFHVEAAAILAEVADPDRQTEPDSLAQYVRHLQNTSGRNSGSIRTLAFLIRFIDFGCVPCLNNFLDFCDALSAAGVLKEDGKIVMICMRDESPERYQRETLDKWARRNKLDFPIYLAREATFDSFELQRSSVVLINETDRVELSSELPLTPEIQREILRRLLENK